MNLKRITLQKEIKLFMLMLISTAFSIGLLVLRYFYTESTMYDYFIWNLFLAWIPFILGLAASFSDQNSKKISIFTLLFLFGWLIFLPNTFYIITDLIHLRETYQIGLWFDLILIFSFVCNGMLLGYISISIVHRILNKYMKHRFSWSIITAVFVLSGFGIYLGRFLRWNSWDILLNPGDLVLDVTDRIINPANHITTWGVTIILSGFLLMLYIVFRLLLTLVKEE